MNPLVMRHPRPNQLIAVRYKSDTLASPNPTPESASRARMDEPRGPCLQEADRLKGCPGRRAAPVCCRRARESPEVAHPPGWGPSRRGASAPLERDPGGRKCDRITAAREGRLTRPPSLCARTGAAGTGLYSGPFDNCAFADGERMRR
jgi:hypothetical protein